MAYRNGTYVAFDGNDECNPAESDQKYFQLLKAWNSNSDIDFWFSDSHSKTYQVKDTSSLETLKNRLKQRMANSKHMLIIISEDTNYDRGLLNYEIMLAIEVYKLPLIIAYTGYTKILNPKLLINKWPKKLREYINGDTAKCIHIPFKKEPILDAISQFRVDDKYPKGSLSYYSQEAYISWGL